MLLLLHFLFIYLFFFRGKELLECDFNNNFCARIDDFLFACVCVCVCVFFWMLFLRFGFQIGEKKK